MSTPLLLISDFNLEPLARLLSHAGEEPRLVASAAPFGQVFQTLAAAAPAPDAVAMVWTRPGGVLETFQRALDFEEIDHARVLAEADRFAELLVRYARNVRYLFVVSWTLPPAHRGYGPIDWRPGLGLAGLVARLNLRLADGLAGVSNAFVLDAERWLRAAGPKASSPNLWYASKAAFSLPVLHEAAADLRAALRGAGGEARRLVVLDLDNTLWGGVVGELGPDGIGLGGHDRNGEAFVDFQRALRGLLNRGVQLAIASKNDEATALQAIDHHPEMRLRRRDFAAWRIHWGDKARSVVELAEEVNLGLRSLVFIDDHPAERARVREALPEVLVPDWPEEPTRYVEALSSLRCFDTASMEREDRSRGAMYAAERERREALTQVGSVEDWIAGLGIRIVAEPLGDANLSRAAQLFNKTNQMNLSTRRMSPAELLAWSREEGHAVWTLSVADRFGDSGLTGLLGLDTGGERARIVDFVLSCRVMGRRVEETMVHLAVAHARGGDARELVARHRPTGRNEPCLRFWQQSRFRADGEGLFVWELDRDYPLPPAVTLVRSGEQAAAARVRDAAS